jgi:hypothetical protein
METFKSLGKAKQSPRKDATHPAALSKMLTSPYRSRLHWGLKEARAFSCGENRWWGWG